ncbi:Beta-glucosidase [Thalictrum thalictroides]|uniref:Beta-glucosidase n=1 Tax=Thalictrum thalictroides TaxID=46969 RepID=A0A7J6WM69_THATH|nr:Beta-glucosidase [Thalictrum thalictroides]
MLPPILFLVMICTNFLSIVSPQKISTFSNSNWEKRKVRAPAIVEKVERSDFPADFSFGATTSAVQTEGAAKLDGKGPSVWDHFIREHPKRITGRAKVDVACDSYHRFKEDIEMLKYMGVTSYRFSIAWTRILPKGSLDGGINQKGIDHYNDILTELEINGIEPHVILVQFDSPQALQEKYGGFLSREMVNDFRDYCDICFQNFGDKVKHWVTINEPTVIAQIGYGTPFAPPSRCSLRDGCAEGNSGTEPYIVTHHIILAHAAAAQLYKEKYKAIQGGEVGIETVGTWYLPNSDAPEDLAATERLKDFNIGWCVEPFIYGHYPISMKNLVKDRLPTFSNEEKSIVMGSLDFIGINYYTSKYAKGLPLVVHEPYNWARDSCVEQSYVNGQGEHIGSQIDAVSGIAYYPDGLRQVLVYLTQRYDSPKLYISENGMGKSTENTKEFFQEKNDDYRIQCIIDHLDAIKRARMEGANVMGYSVWSLMDSFEFLHGYPFRCGLWFTDYNNNLRRLAKKSADWYKSFLSN